MAVKYACPRWLDNVKDQPNVVREEKTYKKTYFPALATRIAKLFTLPDGSQVNVTDKDVEAIYSLCGFEVSFYGRNQTWCQLLEGSTGEETRLAFEILENASDLSDYYSHGPGVPFNKHLGCQLGTSIQDSIEKALAPVSQQATSSSGLQKRKNKEKEMETEGAAAGEGGDDEEDEGEAPAHFKFVLKFGHSETIFFLSTFLVSVFFFMASPNV